MREITKVISVPVDGKNKDFRMTKLDAFSGVTLLRMLARMPGIQGQAGTREQAKGGEASNVLALFSGLSDSEIRSLMITCLEHTEVLLPAGWNPVMTRGEWTYPEVAHDTAVCLKLTAEEIVWTLEGFFGGGSPTSHPGKQAS